MRRFLKAWHGSDTGVGDLARDALADPKFPVRGTYLEYSDYLNSVWASDEARCALSVAWELAVKSPAYAVRQTVARRPLELTVEHHLLDRVKASGGHAIKLGMNGWPDRLVVLPGGKVGFLELKRPGEKPRALQVKRLNELRRTGVVADWADSKEAVDEFLRHLA